MEDREFMYRLRRLDVEHTLDFLLEFQKRWELAGLMAKVYIESIRAKR